MCEISNSLRMIIHPVNCNYYWRTGCICYSVITFISSYKYSLRFWTCSPTLILSWVNLVKCIIQCFFISFCCYLIPVTYKQSFELSVRYWVTSQSNIWNLETTSIQFCNFHFILNICSYLINKICIISIILICHSTFIYRIN